MSWTRLNDQEPDLYYQSKAKTRKEIASDINLVFNKMKERQAEDKAESAEALAFIINATNGYIAMVWYNPTTQKGTGTWKYELMIQDFWKISVDHKEGAFFFDNETHLAICNFMEEHIYDEEGNQSLRLFTRHEIGGLEELVI